MSGQRKLSNPSRPMTPCERGVWIDTEGSIEMSLTARKYPQFRISVSQSEKEPLEEYCAGARKDNIPCRVRYDRTENAYKAEIYGLPNIAKEIVLTRNCIRTKKKRQQIKRFGRHLKAKRKILRKQVIQARKILGL